MRQFSITSFAGGTNTLFDERVIQPNAEGEPAESPVIENVEFTGKGSIITSNGYEKVTELAATLGGFKNIITYEKNVTDKYLVVTHDDDHYYMTPASVTLNSIGDYGTAANNVGGIVYKGQNLVRKLILGTDDNSNDVKSWDGTTFENINTIGTFTVTIASPGVFTLNGHGLIAGSAIRFTTTGALPTGLTAGTTYYVITTGLTANNFQVSATLGGAAVNTSGTQSGTHTATLILSGGYAMETFMRRLFIVSGSVVYYSDFDDEKDIKGGGTLSFPDLVTGIHVEGDYLQAHTKKESYTVQLYYNDSFSLSSPLVKPYKNSSGCLSHKSIVSVFNDSLYLSRDGIQRFGADPQFIGTSTRVNSVSWKIDPSLKPNKLSMAYIDKAAAEFFEKKMYMAVPYGSDAWNSKIFVYDWIFDAWYTRTGFNPVGFAIFPDSTGKEELYFASALTPIIYKFNQGWSYDGGNYDRVWESKIFNFGSSIIQKKFGCIDITGAMYENTTFYVDIIVDGITKTFAVNSDNLVESPSGGFIGDDYLGDIYFGSGDENLFKRFAARLCFPITITEGRELKIKIYNSAAGEPWSVDGLTIGYDYLDPIQIPTEAQSVELT